MAYKEAAFVPPTTTITEDMNLAKALRERAEQYPTHVTIERKAALGHSWVPITMRQFEEQVRALARGFAALGVQPGDRVGLMSHTRYEWSLIDFALWYAGAFAVPIYETSSRSQAEWILSDSRCSFAIVEDSTLQQLVVPLVDEIDSLQKVFVIENGDLDAIAMGGSDVDDAEIDRRIDATKSTDLCTIIYTSGTTGKPKGAKLPHRAMLHLAINGPENVDLAKIIAPKPGRVERTLLFLPMAHVFARFINIVAVFGLSTIGHSPDTTNLVADMQSFRPTYVLAVPRVFEKVYNAADAKAGASPVKSRLFRYFAKVAIAYSRALQTKEGPSAALKAQHKLGQKLVYGTLVDLLGGQLANSISGGGPLGERLGHFFRGVGITIYEGYGLTETAAPSTVNRPGHLKVGTIGQAYPGCRVAVDEDGEILVKGDHVFVGYNNNEEQTKAAFTEDGWFRTGDLGSIDDDGYVTVTGRKKELIVTAGGKNVAPAILEDRMRSHPIISQVIVVGDQRPFIGALVTLDADMLPGWLKNHGLPEMSIDEARENPQVIAAVDRAVTRANAVVSRAESIRKFKILSTDFTVDNDFLTPSMKVKRHKVHEAFAAEIDSIYEKK